MFISRRKNTSGSLQKALPSRWLRKIVFDSNLNRIYRNMPCNYPLEEKFVKLPETLIKEYRVEGVSEDGSVKSITVNNNHQRFVKHKVDWIVKEVRFIPLSTHGCETCNLFSFEIS